MSGASVASVRHDRLLLCLVLYGVLNSVLYCSLMPLWEGFDEPFHYGYVETLSTRREIPVLGRTRLSAEVWESLHVAPLSTVVKHNLPFGIEFSEFFSLPDAERIALHKKLASLPVRLRELDSPQENYEAQQAPLAYLLLAVPNAWLLRNIQLRERILCLRIFGALGAVFLQIAGIWRLIHTLRLGSIIGYMAIFLVLSCQMFYGAIAHVSNDWLAIPLTTWFILALVQFQQAPGYRKALLVGCFLAAGLLTKAYFLSWFLFAVCIVTISTKSFVAFRQLFAMLIPVAVFAGPWYVRNLWLYGTLSGLFTMQSGKPFHSAFPASMTLHWWKVLTSGARGAIWTGNNSFLSFSAITLNIILLLILLGTVLWAVDIRTRSWSKGELLAGLSCLSFLPVLAYSCAVLFAFSGNSASYIAPWYTQAIAAPVACLTASGFYHHGRPGRYLGAVLCISFSYLSWATYILKLVPLYAGYPHSGASLRMLCRWYLDKQTQITTKLAEVTLGNVTIIIILIIMTSFLSVAMCTTICVQLLKRTSGP